MHVWNTCNITSLAMSLEALGMSAADYKYRHLIPPIAEVFTKDVDERATTRSGTDLSGLRLPDFVAMAAIAWQMGYKTGDRDAILEGGNKAFNEVASAAAIIRLAKDFGASPPTRYFKLDRAAKKDHGVRRLKNYGAAHHEEGDERAQARTSGKEVDGDRTRRRVDRARSPARDYKDSILRELAPAPRQRPPARRRPAPPLRAPPVRHDELRHQGRPRPLHPRGMQATWDEARAMGLFRQWISIG